MYDLDIYPIVIIIENYIINDTIFSFLYSTYIIKRL